MTIKPMPLYPRTSSVGGWVALVLAFLVLSGGLVIWNTTSEVVKRPTIARSTTVL
jgi:hypothetical protein